MAVCGEILILYIRYTLSRCLSISSAYPSMQNVQFLENNDLLENQLATKSQYIWARYTKYPSVPPKSRKHGG
ncbi:unnamed protein product [Acanthoscelides obtectus]|uniref:Uncharacterized protein n=1 Tax=Acanthoscelides obtectus TaxID=200917 RepID=A0A9P0LEG0_ACAOB|nr:unnamed protein product [Acanthoscelides obtectus]CAK1671100.1 hypothetical protein AOBTE_LOCUS28056 [Acanthoscelides obtectus]